MNDLAVIQYNVTDAAIAYGYCQCGCGNRTAIARQTDKRRGWKKGEPIRFITGHHSRIFNSNFKGGIVNRHGYWGVKRHDGDGYTFLHRIIAENALGKALPISAAVHHFKDNLVICQDNTFHMLLHQRQRALEACGNATWRKCKFCKHYDDPRNLYIHGTIVHHRSCVAKYARERRRINNGSK